MKTLFHHLLNEARRSVGLARRYWIETLLGLGFVISLFGGLLLAVVKTTGQDLASGQADGLIAGFAIWMFASGAALAAGKEITEETRQRTLEQLCLSPLSLQRLLALRLTLELAVGLLLLALTLAAAAWLTGGRVMPAPALFGLTLLGMPALVGVGYALAGALLLVKRGELLAVAAYPALIALVALPAYPLNGLAVLPYALAAAAARTAALGTAIAPSCWALIALNAGAYLLLGLWLFRRAEAKARRLAVLAHA